MAISCLLNVLHFTPKTYIRTFNKYDYLVVQPFIIL
nr:MAG TPA: hypothetical protein [Caudoviricetes sp.]